MTSVVAMYLTESAYYDILDMGMDPAEALAIVQGITTSDFHKTMAATGNPGYFQDVYKPTHKGVQYYVKFGWSRKRCAYNVVSFKEK